jgi:hypothetical protein
MNIDIRLTEEVAAVLSCKVLLVTVTIVAVEIGHVEIVEQAVSSEQVKAFQQ